ncbi:MAG TPA: hypothetical protein DFR83_24825 [Deltaproteobacteria bacterium]|nr:hypothetical protein [Deltaproteobacteria bacterium]
MRTSPKNLLVWRQRPTRLRPLPSKPRPQHTFASPAARSLCMRPFWASPSHSVSGDTMLRRPLKPGFKPSASSSNAPSDSEPVRAPCPPPSATIKPQPTRPDAGISEQMWGWMTGVLLTLAVGLASPTAEAAEPDHVRRAVEAVEATYGDQVAPAALYRAALEGIAAELDRATGRPGHAVLNAQERAAVEHWLDGHRNGIAAEFAVVPGQGIVITDVYPDGPAEDAGLEVGDLVVALDDHPFTGLPSELILGIAGTSRSPQVVLDIRRPEGLRRLLVSRGPWRLDTARSFQHHGITVVKLPFFGPGSAQALTEALSNHPSGSPLVVDLRTNEGGRLGAMLEVASLFVEADQPITLVDPGTGRLQTHRARAGIALPSMGAITVLVDRDTAGTAEAFAAALRHERGAVLVGTPTAGHAGIPRWIALEDSLSLQMVDQHLLDPAGTSWASTGLVPDILSQSVSHTMPVQAGQLPPDIQLDVAVQVTERAHKGAGQP